MDFYEAVEKGIRLREEEGKKRWEAEDRDGRFHVSDATSCPLKVLLRRRGTESTNEEPLESILVKEAGKVFHELLQDAHRRAGTLVRADFEDEPWAVAPDDTEVRGHPDLLTLLSSKRGLELWDVKSLKEGGYRDKRNGYRVIDTIKEDDGEQLNAYMGLLGVTRGGIVYVNRNNGEFNPIPWTFRRDLWEESQAKLAALRKWEASGLLPDPLDATRFPCTYRTKDGIRVDCRYYSRCHPEAQCTSRKEKKGEAVAA